VPRSIAKGEEDLYAMARDARFVVLEPACHSNAAARLSEFRREAQRGDREIWIRSKTN